MPPKPAIAILGATGIPGREVARRLVEQDCLLILVSEETKKLKDLISSWQPRGLRAEIVTPDCAREACWEADIIVLTSLATLPLEVVEKIRPVATGKWVVCITDEEEGRLTFTSLKPRLPHSRLVESHDAESAAGLIDRIIEANRGKQQLQEGNIQSHNKSIL